MGVAVGCWLLAGEEKGGVVTSRANGVSFGCGCGCLRERRDHEMPEQRVGGGALHERSQRGPMKGKGF